MKANKFHTNARVRLKCIKFHINIKEFHTNSIKFHTNLAKTQNVQKTIAQYHPICYDFINTSREGGVLIQINRKIPESYYNLIRLKHRLPISHKKYNDIVDEINITKAGYHGETRTDYFIQEVEFPQDVHIIPDFHIKLHNNRYIQIDTLIITKSYILIVEVKNIKGTIIFKDYPRQIVRVLNEKTRSFKCPVVQLERNLDGIEKWLTNNNWNLPIYTALVFASETTIVENAPTDQKIFFAKDFPLYIQKLNNLNPALSQKQFQQLTKELIQTNNNFIEMPLCRKYNIDTNELKSGVLCKSCGDKLFRINQRKWTCQSCGQEDTNPIANNLEDFFVLMKNEITMVECLRLLELESRFTLNYTFQKMQLIKTGKGKSTIYRKNPSKHTSSTKPSSSSTETP
ncbi:NERD domain-containing protein [Psychrobacillus insolitus]|uniref:NERD domain-containing protein n=1 Tax=Psychrobacillus insolitus TaxID=1461 RepID=UPI000DAE9343